MQNANRKGDSRGRKACTRPPRLKGRGSFPKNSAVVFALSSNERAVAGRSQWLENGFKVRASFPHAK